MRSAAFRRSSRHWRCGRAWHGTRISTASRRRVTIHPEPLAEESQSDLFGAAAEPADRPDPDRVRARLHRILAETRSATSLDRAKLSLYRTIFPQMTLFLPDEEGTQLRFEFEAEMARLQAA